MSQTEVIDSSSYEYDSKLVNGSCHHGWSYYFWKIARKVGMGEVQMDYLRSVVCAICAGIYFFGYILVCEPLTCLILESLPLRYKVQGHFVRVFEYMLNTVYERCFTIEIIGKNNINPENLSIVTSNHQGFIDYLTIMNLSTRCGIDNSVFFFVWKHCVRLPSIRVFYNEWCKRSNWRIPNVMLPSVYSPILESPWKDQGGKWVVVFPEVTPWSMTYMLEHRTECAENGCPKLQNLLYPRFNAFVQTLTFLRDYPVADIYDITLIYINQEKGQQVGVPKWTDLLFSRKAWKIQIVIRKVAATSIPFKEKHIVRWLEKQWYQKDEAISEVKKKLTTQANGQRKGSLLIQLPG